MSPKKLRLILAVSLLALFASAGVGVYFAAGYLSQRAQEVSMKISAAKNNGNVTTGDSTQIQNLLNSNKTSYDKAALVAVDSANFQSQVNSSLKTIASKAGLTITNIKFDNVTANVASTKAFSVEISSPLSYTSLLKFIKYSEESLPKMQIQTMNITNAGNGMVSVDQTVMYMFTR